ncbi:cytochrome c oxidase assembly protein [Actinotalea sp. K2]|uniref:cytochrome c oxidase assembly protein n=1 Tax=Actinotalea sp. K2 TaxID=2939438 RepID=UPI0020177996|nr:cytochrome c oxidase assembly protein [Actinotalea sp. K2]MCL3861665.1 bifunctional copper resistance protein CopD/cytochrome c oxidase assembly protein [Actinotalea sp. K2]
MPEQSVTTPRPLAVAAVVGVVVVGVLAAVAGVAYSGAALPSVILDPGGVVRWGLPVVTVVAELAASVSLGALVLAAFVLPRGTGRTPSDGRAWPAVMVVASVAAGTWAVTGVVHLVLTYGSVTGSAVGGPTFGSELGLFVASVSLGRTLLGIIVVAAVTCALALLVTSPVGALGTALFAGVALAMQSQTGHAAGSVSHDLSISSMFLHLGGAATWIGGLAALALVAHRLGPDLAPAVARYSPVAAWCFVAVAVSGTVNAAIRVGGLEGLTTTYGSLVVVKVVLFCGLGLLGLAHRRAVIPRLVARTGSLEPGAATRAPWLFWRLVAVELALMGAVSGVAVALSSTAPPVPQLPVGELTPAEIVTGHPLPPAPTVELWLTSFRWDLIPALGCLAGAVVYLRWVRRLRRRGDRWPVGRTLSALTGLVLLAWTTSGGPAVYGHVLFSAHMIQHMVLVMIVPIFIVLSAPVTLAARALPARLDGSRGPREWILGLVHSRWAMFFAHPVVAAVNFAGSMIVFYYTVLFELSLTTYIGHLGMIAHFSVAGYLFVNALVGIDPGPQRPGYPVRMLLLFATMAFHAFFGVALVSAETLLVPEWFGLLGRPWGPSAIADQQTGGAIAWGISELPMLALAIVLALAWTRDDERTARRRDRAADRDGDADLTEYNAMLTRLGDRDA